MNRLKVINLFGGPGSSKSTSAAGLFFKMKMQGYSVELVTELAKEITWEGHQNLLSDQLFLFANQNRRLERLRGNVDYVITDCPILLGLAYTPDNYYQSFSKLVKEVFDSYQNLNFFVKRDKPYVNAGRNQTEEEANQVSSKVKQLLYDNLNFNFFEVLGNSNAPDEILKVIKDYYE